MKAYVVRKAGGADVLCLQDVDVPTAGNAALRLGDLGRAARRAPGRIDRLPHTYPPAGR